VKTKRCTVKNPFWSEWAEISPSENSRVKEYKALSTYFKIWMEKGTFSIGALRKQYQSVIRYLKQNTTFDLCVDVKYQINEYSF